MSKDRVSCGYEVSVNTAYSKPPLIYIHKLGSSDATWLTPDELSTFIAMLTDVLSDARAKESL